MLADLYVVTTAEVTEAVESRMAKIHNKIKVKVVETVTDTFEDAIQPRYSDSNEGLK